MIRPEQLTAETAAAEAKAAMPAMLAAIEGQRFLYDAQLRPAGHPSWDWLTAVARTAQMIVRVTRVSRMRVLVTWEYDADESRR